MHVKTLKKLPTQMVKKDEQLDNRLRNPIWLLIVVPNQIFHLSQVAQLLLTDIPVHIKW